MQSVFVVLALFMLLLSAGGLLKKTLYEFFPLLLYIRTNGEFRVFVIFSCIVCASYELEKLLAPKQLIEHSAKALFKRTAFVLASVACITIFLAKPFASLPSINASMPAQLKYLIDEISFMQSLFIAAACAFALSVLYLYSFLKKNKLYFLFAFITDVIINCWFMLPITGVSQTPVSKMQAIIERSPDRFPIPSLQNGIARNPLTPEEENLIGSWSWYSKEINHAVPIDYPSMLKSTKAYFDSVKQGAAKDRSLAFLKNHDGHIVLKRFSPSNFEMSLTISQPDTLVLLQNNFPGWQAWVNEKEATLSLNRNTFLQVPVDKNTKTVTFCFSPF
jgi:hypothetical protein